MAEQYTERPTEIEVFPLGSETDVILRKSIAESETTGENGDVATCVGVSDNGWSKLEYKGETCYAVTSYLTPVGSGELPTQPEDDGIQTQFEEINDLVTAKVEVNLRSLPSVEDPDCVVVASLKNGEVVTRTGINRDVGWSRVEYNGQTLYCVSSYLMAAEAQQKG